MNNTFDAAINLGLVSPQQPLRGFEGTNVGATMRSATFADTLYFTEGTCFGTWADNTVFYRFTLPQGFKNVQVRLTPLDGGRFYMLLHLPDLTGRSRGIWYGTTDRCATAPGQTLVSYRGEFNDTFGCLPLDTRGYEIYLLVGSPSDAGEGRFRIEMDAIVPTYCDRCNNGNETIIDGPFGFQVSATPSEFSTPTGTVRISGVVGGTPPLSFSVDGQRFQSAPLFEGLPAGTYTVMMQDRDGCRVSRSATIGQNPASAPAVPQPPPVCEGEPAPEVTVPGEGVRWYADSLLTQLVHQGNRFRPELTRNSTYYVTIQAGGQASRPAAVLFRVLPRPSVQLSLTGTACLPARLQARASRPGLSFTWSRNGVPIAGAQDSVLVATQPGVYTVAVTEGPCTGRSEPIELFPPPASVALPVRELQLCEGMALPEWSATPPPSGRVVWYADRALSQPLAEGTRFRPQTIQTGRNQWWVRVENGPCYGPADSVMLTLLPGFELRADTSSAICVGEPIMVSASRILERLQLLRNGVPIQTASDVQQAAFTIPSDQASYNIIGVSGICQLSLGPLRPRFLPLPQLSAQAGPKVCKGDSILLQTTTSGTLAWRVEGQPEVLGTSPRLWVRPDQTTRYELSVTDQNGCTTTRSVVAEVEIRPLRADFFPSEAEGQVPLEVFFTNRSRFATSYFWDFGDGRFSTEASPQHIYQYPSEYTVRLYATLDSLCFDMAEFPVKALFELNIPNAISPNGDGANDQWIIDGIERFEGAEVQIFNQWGQKVWEARPYRNQWDARGLPDGTYFYILRLNEWIQPLNGHILVIR